MKTEKNINKIIVLAGIFLFLIISLVTSKQLKQDQVIAHASARFNYGIASSISTIVYGKEINYTSYVKVLNAFRTNGIERFSEEKDRIPAMKDASILNYAINSTLQIQNPEELGAEKMNREDKGQVYFFIGAFKTFGLKIESLVNFYYLLLFISAAFFVLEFSNRLALLLIPLSFAFIHCIMMTVIWNVGIELLTPVNPRYFSVLAIIPCFHLVFSVFYSDFKWKNIIFAIFQTLLLVLVIISRSSSQYFLLFVFGSIALGWAYLNRDFLKIHLLRFYKINYKIVLLILVLTFSTLSAYKKNLAVTYTPVEETHYFWHPLFLGLFYHPTAYTLHGEQCCSDMTSFNLFQKHLDELSTDGKVVPFTDAGFENFLKEKSLNIIKNNKAYTIKNYIYKAYRILTLPLDRQYPLMNALFSWKTLLFAGIWIWLIVSLPLAEFIIIPMLAFVTLLSSLPSMMLAPEYYAASDFTVCYLMLLLFLPFLFKFNFSKAK